MKRVLHVIGSLNNGGSQAMVMELYRNINRSKLQFDFVIHRPEELFYEKEILSLGGKIHFLPALNLNNVAKYRKNWVEFFKSHSEYKIIHGHVRSTASIYLNVAKKCGLTTISHSHSTSSGVGISAIVKDILQYPIRFVADYFFACSLRAGKWLFGKNTIQKENFYIVRNAIDIQKYIFNEAKRLKIRDEFNLESKLVIGHIGRFSYPKNQLFLLDIYKEVFKKNSNSVLILVGDGELRQQIEEKIITLGLKENVILTGIRSDVPELLQAFDVFVCPSLYEGLGIVAIEAQAAGLPCIVADTLPKAETCLTQLIEYLPLKKDPSFWANKILASYRIFNRENKFNEIQSAGYDISVTSKKVEKFYLDISKAGDY